MEDVTLVAFNNARELKFTMEPLFKVSVAMLNGAKMQSR